MKSKQPVKLTLKDIILPTLWAVAACLAAINLLMLIKWTDLLTKIVATDENFFSVWEIFFSVFGVLYAIVVGLLIMDALRRLRDLSATIQDEVSTIEDVWEAIGYIDNSGDNKEYKEKIEEALRKYVGSVIEEEWDEMKDVKKGKAEQGMSIHLNKVVANVGKIRVDRGRNYIAVEALIGKMADLTSHRSKRRELALQVFHHPLHILIIFMSLVIAVGFLFLNVGSIWVHIFIVCAIVLSLFTLLAVIRDLDNPYGGYWAIHEDPFINVGKTLEGARRSTES